MSYDAATLAQQLGDLGRDLQAQVSELGRLEEQCVDAEAAYRVLQEIHEDILASCFLRSGGSNADARKADARLSAADSRVAAEVAWKAWQQVRAQVRVQQASLQAIHRRIEIGRSLLSREKSLLSLTNSGIDVLWGHGFHGIQWESKMGYKMVRDNHQKILEGQISGAWRTAPDPISSLIKKLGEEYSEIAEERNPAELYDLLDALEELIRLMDPEGIAAARHAIKAERMGTFSTHLEWHPNPDLNLWALWGEEK
jgi:predicted house-cleaning noncanonical NTP pyrophosphatase (MazG superfamily)